MTVPADLVSGIVHLVPLPRAYLRIRELVRDPETPLNEIVDIIVNDPAMTARLLRIANSAYFGLGGKIETVARAVTVLGLDQVHDLALVTSAVPAITGLGHGLVDMHTFWRRSIYCAVLARRLARQAGVAQPDRQFVAGLLHCAGHLILCHHLPEDMRAIRTRIREEGRPRSQIERDTLGFDYAEVGGELMKAWQLPVSLEHMVAWHTRPGGARAYVLETAITHIASIVSLAEAWRGEDDEPVPEFALTAFQVAGIDENQIEELMQDSDEEVIEAFQLLMPATMRQPPARAAAYAR